MNLFSLKFRQHWNALRTSFQQLSANRFLSLMTFSVIGIALALPLCSYVLFKNMGIMTQGLQMTTQITLYLHDNSSAVIDNLNRILQTDKEIKSVRYISPDEGFKEFQEQSQLGNILQDLKTNPLPPVFIIQPVDRIQTIEQAQQMINRLKRLPSVDDIKLDMTWLQRLNAIVNLGHRLTLALSLFFIVSIFLIIGNTVQLATQNYRQEVEVYKLLGATDSFVRLPFIYSGIIYGLMGSIIAWLFVDGVVFWLQKPLQHLAALYQIQFDLKGLNMTATLYLLLLGISIGYLSSWMSSRQHIQSIEPE